MPAPKIDGRETRAIITPLELRATAEGSVRTGVGYAALFDTWTDIGGMWRERIAPGAFTKSLQERDVLARGCAPCRLLAGLQARGGRV